MREIQQIPRLFWLAKRKILPIGLLLSAVWAVLALSHRRPGSEIYALVAFAYFLFSYFRTRRGGGEIPRIPEEYQFYEVYGFFGACFIIGMTFFVLAMLGVAHIEMVIGIAGLIGAAASAYAIVREAQNMQRRRRKSAL
jgi:hypothetical protein